MSWKKRGKAGWTGKKEAKSKPSVERNFAKDEIRQELKEIEEGDGFRYKAGGKNKNKIASLKYWIDLYERRAIAVKARGLDCRWFGYTRYNNGATEMKKELEELEEKNNDTKEI